jgi:uncharacterized protein
MTKMTGFATLDQAGRIAVAARGGRASQASGRGHKFTSEKAKEAGRIGGTKVSQDREYMVRIGRLGGTKVSQDREHMARIGRIGGRKPASGVRYAAYCFCDLTVRDLFPPSAICIDPDDGELAIKAWIVEAGLPLVPEPHYFATRAEAEAEASGWARSVIVVAPEAP